MNELTVTRTRSVLFRACPTGQHIDHDGLTCAEADTVIHAEQAMLDAAVDRAIRQLDRTPMAEVPAALRGPNWSSR